MLRFKNTGALFDWNPLKLFEWTKVKNYHRLKEIKINWKERKSDAEKGEDWSKENYSERRKKWKRKIK